MATCAGPPPLPSLAHLPSSVRSPDTTRALLRDALGEMDELGRMANESHGDTGLLDEYQRTVSLIKELAEGVPEIAGKSIPSIQEWAYKNP